MKSRDWKFFKELFFSHNSEQILPFPIYLRIYFESEILRMNIFGATEVIYLNYIRCPEIDFHGSI